MLNIYKNSVNKKIFQQKNFDLEKFDEKLNTAIKILNSSDKDIINNSLIPYESLNYIQKVQPQKKANLNLLDNNNIINEDSIDKNVLNSKTFSNKDDGLLSQKPTNSFSNELANFSSSNVLDILTSLIYNKNYLPFGDERKIAFEEYSQGLALINVYLLHISLI